MSRSAAFHTHCLPRVHRPSALTLLPVSLLVLALAGCGITAQNFDNLPAGSGEIQGSFHGGRTPISGTTVQIWAAGSAGYGTPSTLLAETITDSRGFFGFAPGAYACPQANTPVYLTGQGGNPGLQISPNSPTLVLAAGLGTCARAKTTIVAVNEVTTIATAYALAQFFTTTLGHSPLLSNCSIGNTCAVDSFGGPSKGGLGNIAYSIGLTNANSYTIPTLVTLSSGVVTIDNPYTHPEAPKIYSLANAIAACVNSTGGAAGDGSACGSLFADTTPPTGIPPTDTLQAAVQMALHPYQNVKAIFYLAPPASPYTYPGALTTAPADLSVGISYTSNAFKLTVPSSIGTSNLAIDAAGKVWLPTTSPAGIAVFDPSSASFAGPFAAASAGAPLNIAIDHEGLVWVPDTSSVEAASFTTTNPPISTSYTTGLSGSLYTVAVATDDTVVLPANISGLGNALGGVGLPRAMGVLLPPVPQHQVTGIASSSEGANFYYLATRSGTTGYMEISQGQTVAGPTAITLITPTPGGSGQIAEVNNPSMSTAPDFIMTAPLGDTFCSYLLNQCFGINYIGISGPQGVAVDGNNYVWIANSISASVTEFPGYTTIATPYTGGNSGNPAHGPYNGATMVQPFGIGIDGSGNVWVSNQTAPLAGSPYVLSEIVGSAAPTITPLSAQINGGLNRVGSRP